MRPEAEGRIVKWWIVSFVSFLVPVIASAQIVFERDTVEVSPAVDQRELTHAFSFVNSGTYEVTILDLTPSCPCNAVTLKKRRYQPGELGEIPVTLVSHILNGRDEASVKVTTDDRAPVKTLRLVVSMKSYVDFLPALITWKDSEARETKDVIVRAAQSNRILVTGARCTANCRISVAADADRRSFILRIEPSGPGKFHDVAVVTVDVEGIGTRVYELPLVGG